MKTASKVQVEIRQHPEYPETHRRVIVTTAKGYCYCCDWAEPWPADEDAVRKAWQEDRASYRAAFLPYYGA